MDSRTDAPRAERPDGNEPSDGALVDRAAGGDEAAWEIIIARYSPYLGSIGRGYGLRHEEFSDAVQETWLSAVTHLASLRNPARFRPWLATIMRRNCLQMIEHRRQDREWLVGDVTDMVGGELRDEQVDIEHEVLTAERASVLREALRLLPERERQLMHQLVADNSSYGEITWRLSMPVGSIGPTRMRALRHLRLILEQAHAGDLFRAA